MGANKYENFSVEVIDREDIHEADYNPRRISDNAFRKLKRWFQAEGKGQLQPLIVNKNTMTLVSGHQRLRILDQLHRGKSYQLSVCMVDLDEKTEVEANVFMNNTSAMGEFDFEMIAELKQVFPDVSLTDGFGFDESEISIMFDDEDIKTMMGDDEDSNVLKADAKKFISDVDVRKNDLKKVEESEISENQPLRISSDVRQKARDRDDVDGSTYINKDDYTIVIVCASNTEKRDLMTKLKEKPTERFIKSSKLYDIYDHKIKLRELS